MAIDPKLLVLKPVSELETVSNPITRAYYFNDGGDKLKKTNVSDFYNAIKSAYLGIATTTTTPPATGAYWYRVDTAGTYTNFKKIQVMRLLWFPQGIFDGTKYYDVTIEVKDNVATKRKSEKPKGLDGKTIETWTAKDYAKGSTVYHNGDIWESFSSATSTDEPNENSSIWMQRIKTINNVTTVDVGFVTDEKRNIAFKVDENGETSFNQKGRKCKE